MPAPNKPLSTAVTTHTLAGAATAPPAADAESNAESADRRAGNYILAPLLARICDVIRLVCLRYGSEMRITPSSPTLQRAQQQARTGRCKRAIPACSRSRNTCTRGYPYHQAAPITPSFPAVRVRTCTTGAALLPIAGADREAGL